MSIEVPMSIKVQIPIEVKRDMSLEVQMPIKMQPIAPPQASEVFSTIRIKPKDSWYAVEVPLDRSIKV